MSARTQSSDSGTPGRLQPLPPSGGLAQERCIATHFPCYKGPATFSARFRRVASSALADVELRIVLDGWAA
jgi:hypothetical protein